MSSTTVERLPHEVVDLIFAFLPLCTATDCSEAASAAYYCFRLFDTHRQESLAAFVRTGNPHFSFADLVVFAGDWEQSCIDDFHCNLLWWFECKHELLLEAYTLSLPYLRAWKPGESTDTFGPDSMVRLATVLQREKAYGMVFVGDKPRWTKRAREDEDEEDEEDE